MVGSCDTYSSKQQIINNKVEKNCSNTTKLGKDKRLIVH